MKRVFVLLLFIFVFSTSSCTFTKVKKTVTNPKKLEGKLTVCASTQDEASMKIVIADFKSEYPKVEIDLSLLDEEAVYNKLSTDLIGNNSEVDLVAIENSYLPGLLYKYPLGFVNLSDYISKKNYSSSNIELITSKNGIMAMPWYEDVSVLYYRRDIFKSLGIDPMTIKTWEDYLSIGSKIKEATMDKIRLVGLNFNNSNAFKMLLNQLNASYFDDNDKCILGKEKAITVLTLLKQLQDSKYVNGYTDNKSLVNLLKNDSIATIPYGGSLSGVIEKECPEESGKWGIIKLPAFEVGGNRAGFYSSTSLMVPIVSKNIELASEFVSFAGSDKNALLKINEDNKLMPEYAPAYDSLDFKKKSEYFAFQNINSILIDLDNQAMEVNYNNNYDEVNKMLLQAQKSVLFDNSVLRETLTQLMNKINNSLLG
ncbi:MAG TPA: extracellular solute-binding protein [Clostridiaceae bacterium]